MESSGDVSSPQNKSSYFVRHWRGELSLAQSYWVNNVIFTVVILTFFALIDEGINFEESYKLSSFLAIIFYVMVIPISIWQLVGIWRSATNYSLKTTKLWGSLAKISVIIGIINFASALSQTIVPQISEFWKIATISDKDRTYQLRVLRDASELEFSGELEFGITDDMRKHLDAHPTIKLIHLNSDGGRMLEARKLASLIEKRNLVTYTSTNCISACIIPFAAGKQRLISKTGKLGFHQGYFPGIKQGDLSVEHKKAEEYLLYRGVEQNFVNKIYNIPYDKLWFPSHEELLKSNFITGYPTSNQVAVSGVKISDLDKLEKELLKIPMYLTLKEKIPQGYEFLIKTLRSGFERGKSIEEIRSLTIPTITKIYLNYLPYASDSVLIKSTEHSIERLKKLRNINPEFCYKVTLGNDIKFDPDQFLPAEFVREGMDIGSDIIKTYTQQRTIATIEEAQIDLKLVASNLAEIFGQDVMLLDKSTHSSEERSKYCNLNIAFMQRILELPKNKVAPLLRLLIKEAKN